MSVIRPFARQVVERFRPDTIILFGSYVYDRPHGVVGWWGGVGPPASGPVIRGAHASFDLEMGCDTQPPKKVTGQRGHLAV
jgi:hypothetical protein